MNDLIHHFKTHPLADTVGIAFFVISAVWAIAPSFRKAPHISTKTPKEKLKEVDKALRGK